MNRIRRDACGGLAQRIERRQPPARASADRQRKSLWTYQDFPRMKHGCGLVAVTDWTWTDHGLGLCAVVDWIWSRSSCGHGQFTDWTRTCYRIARERGLCADTDKLRSRSRTGCGHGPDMVTVKMRAWTDHGRGCGLDMDKLPARSRTGRGHGLATDIISDNGADFFGQAATNSRTTEP